MENIKCVIVGDGTVGKTSLLINFTSDRFSTDYVPTIFDNYQSNILVNSKPITLNLWDTAGQEEFDKIRPISYRNTDIFIICYSVNDIKSLNNIFNKWIPELTFYCPDIPYILVGTKVDLKFSKPDSYYIDIDIVKNKSNKNVFECSSKTKYNVKKIFNEAVIIGLLNREKIKKKNNCIIF